MAKWRSQLAGVGILVGLSACGAAAPLPPARPKAESAARPPAPKPPRERLLGLLRAVERPASVLELLPADAQASLDTRLQGLGPEQREQLLASELARSVPLLQLKAGGTSAPALFALATTPVAAQELPQAFTSPPGAGEAERRNQLQRLHDVAQRAAQHFLRDRVLDLASLPASELEPLLSHLERAAIAAERPDIERLALETWAEAGGGADVQARLGVACARDEDEKCFELAVSRVPAASEHHARLAKLERALKARHAGEPLVRAWAKLDLGRYAEARQALAPLADKARLDLRVASALAVAAADGTSCPGLQPEVGSPPRCADAVALRPGLATALADMQAAWQSGAGRDAASTEAYLGLAHVVPWVTALAIATDRESLARDFGERYLALEQVLRELPEQKAFAVFASALAAGVTAGLATAPGHRPQIEQARKQELWFAALSVEAAAPRLAVSAVLAADQAVLALLPDAAPTSLASARAGLLAWEAAGDAEVVERARSALADQVALSAKGSTQGAQAVLLLAELDALSAPSERTQRALSQVSSQLIAESLPPELALRAVLDTAGALERMGRVSEALGVLQKASEIDSLPGPAGDLLLLIRAERLVLEWDEKRDPQRAQLAKKLGALGGSLSPTVDFVVGAWASPKLLQKGKAPPRAQLEERVGMRAAELVARGVLRGTRVSLRVSYAFQTGITPEVSFEPMFVPLVRPELIQKAL
jgi:hypothetical protein